jgi:hypothetical protein
MEALAVILTLGTLCECKRRRRSFGWSVVSLSSISNCIIDVIFYQAKRRLAILTCNTDTSWAFIIKPQQSHDRQHQRASMEQTNSVTIENTTDIHHLIDHHRVQRAF